VTELYPGGGPINTAAAISIYGTGFTTGSTVAVNGDRSLQRCLHNGDHDHHPGRLLAFPGNLNVTVTTPGGTSTPIGFTTFLSIANNDIAITPPMVCCTPRCHREAVGGPGNSVVGIDPTTGDIARTIFAGSIRQNGPCPRRNPALCRPGWRRRCSPINLTAAKS